MLHAADQIRRVLGRFRCERLLGDLGEERIAQPVEMLDVAKEIGLVGGDLVEKQGHLAAPAGEVRKV